MQKHYARLPETPGVYLMKDAKGKLLYVGKAGNLRRRVASYFVKAHDARIEKLINQVRKIDYKKTDTVIEALILEAALIKKHLPPFNVREKDDKSFLYVEIMEEEFPRVLLVRGKSTHSGVRYGPFTSASHIREALRIMRKIFPFSTHANGDIFKRACFEYQIGLCPGTCIGVITKNEYKNTITNLKLFFEGKKQQIVKHLTKEMKTASKGLEFERAAKLRGQLFALQHIHDVALVTDSSVMDQAPGPKNQRIEGYDISNISGTSAVGSMVVFIDGEPTRDEYRKFKIRTVKGQNDVGMLEEVLRRRLGNNWPLPDLILVDGGKGQINAVRGVLRAVGLGIPIIGIAKGPERRRNDIIGRIPPSITKETLIRVRDEAHRFAISYHRKLRGVISKNSM